MNEAKRLNTLRLLKELQNHRERIVWLQTARPLWADGVPVDSYSKRHLLEQSKALVEFNEHLLSERVSPDETTNRIEFEYI